MAFGIALSVTPEAGIYTAIVSGFLVAALGGSATDLHGTRSSAPARFYEDFSGVGEEVDNDMRKARM